jgi:hypothetical protein
VKKRIGFIVLLCIVITTAQEQKKTSENRVKIGILTLEQFDKASEIAQKAQYDLVAIVKDIGFYECFDQPALEAILEKTGDKIPRHCRDPKCVVEVGRLTGMDRMISGSIEWGNSVCGVKLTLIDIMTRQTIETVSLQGGNGVPVSDVLKMTVAKLHGREQATGSFNRYFGPKIFNERQCIIASAASIGIGLIYGIINYSVEQKHAGSIDAEYRDERLSGIATTGVPLFARPAALANSYVAVSDDAYGVLYNPAGMAWVSGPQAVLAYQYRFGLDNFAASYVNKATREIGFGQALLYRADREQLMRELYFVSALAYKFNNLPYIRPFSFGVNLNLTSNRVKSTSELSSGGNSLGIGLDAGLMWELSEQIRYGLLFRDIPVFHYWKNIKTGERYFESQPTTLSMGGTFKAGYTTLLVAEGQIPLYDDQPWKMAGGLEQEFFNLFCLRIGLRREIMTSYEAPWQITGGFGMKVTTDQESGRYLSLDGSYEYNTLQVFDVINVSMRFGF